MATQAQINQQNQIRAFLKVAQTRSGVTFNVTSIQMDSVGNINMMKGTVTPEVSEENQAPKAEIMYWQPTGQSYSPERGFDLVHDIPLLDFLNESTE